MSHCNVIINVFHSLNVVADTVCIFFFKTGLKPQQVRLSIGSMNQDNLSAWAQVILLSQINKSLGNALCLEKHADPTGPGKKEYFNQALQ